MTLIRHELKRGWKALLIWTLAIGSFIVICLFMYPEMKGQMDNISSIFSSMGAFSSAFGLDTLDFGSLKGFYGIECGNILGIGGALFAALLGIGALANEEKNGTAEFLLTHPRSRTEIITAKLASVLIQIVALNLVVWLLAVASTAAIGEAVPWKEFTLLHLAYFLRHGYRPGTGHRPVLHEHHREPDRFRGLPELYHALRLLRRLRDHEQRRPRFLPAADRPGLHPGRYCPGLLEIHQKRYPVKPDIFFLYSP